MQDIIGPNSRLLRITLILISIIASIYLIELAVIFLSQFTQVLIILFMAWIISIIVRPIVGWLSKHNISKTNSVLLTFLGFFLILTGLIIYIVPQVVNELVSMGKMLSSLDISSTSQHFLSNYSISVSSLKQNLVNPLTSILSYLIANSISTAGTLLNTLFSLVMAFFFAFFFVEGGESINKYILYLIPKDFRKGYLMITNGLDTGLSSFIRGQVLISLIYSLIVMLAMKLLGLPFILIAGIFTLITFVIPLFGAGISLIVPLLIALPTFGRFVILAVVLILVQQVLLNIILPKIYSKEMNIHPAIVILSILLGFEWLGIMGALIALPIASVIQTLLKYYMHDIQSQSNSS